MQIPFFNFIQSIFKTPALPFILFINPWHVLHSLNLYIIHIYLILFCFCVMYCGGWSHSAVHYGEFPSAECASMRASLRCGSGAQSGRGSRALWRIETHYALAPLDGNAHLRGAGVQGRELGLGLGNEKQPRTPGGDYPHQSSRWQPGPKTPIESCH